MVPLELYFVESYARTASDAGLIRKKVEGAIKVCREDPKNLVRSLVLVVSVMYDMRIHANS